MVQFLPLAPLQYPSNAQIDYAPVTNALAQYRQATNQAEQWPYQRNALLADLEQTKLKTEAMRQQLEAARAEFEFMQPFRDALLGRGDTPGGSAAPAPATSPAASPRGPLPSVPGVSLYDPSASAAVAPQVRGWTGAAPQATPAPANLPTAEELGARIRRPEPPLGANLPGAARGIWQWFQGANDARNNAPVQRSAPPPTLGGPPVRERAAVPSRTSEAAPPGGNMLQQIGSAIGGAIIPSAAAAEPAPQVSSPPSRIPLPPLAPQQATSQQAVVPSPVEIATRQRLENAAGLGVTPLDAAVASAPASPAPAQQQRPAQQQGGIRGVFSGMDDRTRLAAYLLFLKKDYGELAKLLQGQTKGSEALDTEFAKELASWRAGGGFADVQRQTAQLRSVERDLSSGANLTGPITGQLPDRLQAWWNPAALATRQRVEEVVQRSLRQVLGAQFTEREAERLVARAYDPTLPEGENLRRVRALLGQIEAAGVAKETAARYFEQHGTLRGWQGRMPTIADFDAIFDTGPQNAAPAPGTRLRFNPETGQIE